MSELFAAKGLRKAYPGVVAIDDVSFSIGEGEVHALLGENGAGKSTLVKMIYGLVKPDKGSMAFRAAPYAPTEPRAARAAGVAMVFQHFSLFDALSVAENVSLGMENPPKPSQLARRITNVSAEYGLPLSPDHIVGDLSAGERQRVEIIRCLLQDPSLLIMDEPTSVLTPQEVEILFATLEKLRAKGTSILYISHKLEEIRSLCDRATILRRGKVVGTATPRESSVAELAEMMVGSALHPPKRVPALTDKVALEVRDLTLKPATPFGTALKGLSLKVRRGEVLGIGGVAGNGQDELLAALSGEMPCRSDAILLHNQPIGKLSPPARRRLGLLCAPEERLGHAAAPEMSLTENALLSACIRKELSKNGFINWHATQAYAENVIEAFDVRTAGPNAAARALSGGNLQKFVMGREINQAPEVLVVNQPTWGVDASAASAIRQALLDLVAQGAAVIAISQDLDELMEISSNFAALNAGNLSDPVPVEGLTMERIGLMMGGAQDMEAVHKPCTEEANA